MTPPILGGRGTRGNTVPSRESCLGLDAAQKAQKAVKLWGHEALGMQSAAVSGIEVPNTPYSCHELNVK